MSDFANEIVLRPRFQVALKTDIDKLKAVFDQSEEESFVVKRLDDHIYIKFKSLKIIF
ncbi:hypothetical protein AB1A65_15985 [Muricauda sp. ANG21]|uniref:hypothetical protein n=1 Tax=Allomuricauda sp. ANG21 TaxID=3042468 RepID=UPI003452780C